MKDNARVIARMRPILQFEDEPAWIINHNTIKCMHSKSVKEKISKSMHAFNESQFENYQFSFDRVAEQGTSSERIYKSQIRPIVESALLQGKNCTVVAYGQTCSGKTYTLLGVKEAPGFIPCIFRDIFHHNSQNRPHCTFQISYSEIYNEKLIDLLNPTQNALKIANSNQWGTQITNITRAKVSNFEDCLQVLDKGQENRKYAEKINHERSSRSHTILKIYIEKWDRNLQCVRSIINVVDLAGSERLGLTESNNGQTKHINKSLFQFSNVIAKLSQSRDQYIPYRDSKLTRLLEASLTKNSNVAIIFCISPAVLNFGESVSTLRLAIKAKNVKIQISYSQNPESKQLTKLKEVIKIQQQQIKRLNEKILQLTQQIESLSSLKQKQKEKENIKNQSKYISQSPIFQQSTIELNEFQKEIGLKILAWGCKKDGRIFKNENQADEIVRTMDFSRSIDISCGAHHTLLVNQNGEVFGWGKNDQKQISNSKAIIIQIPKPIKIKSRIIQVAAGWAHSLLLTDKGKIYSFGFGEDGQLGHGNLKSISQPTLIEMETIAASIYAGHSHSGFIDNQSNYYSFGFNKDYRLMIAESKTVSIPTKVRLIGIVKAALGISHTCLLTKHGKVYAGGIGTNGELGVQLNPSITGYETIQVPQKSFDESPFQKVCPLVEVEFCHNKKIIDISCGQCSTAVITDSHQLYTFGKTSFDRLGHSEQRIKKILDNVDCVQMGYRHGFAWHSKTKQIYAWGFNMYNQLGILQAKDLKTPQLIHSLSTRQILKISTGFFHSAAIAK